MFLNGKSLHDAPFLMIKKAAVIAAMLCVSTFAFATDWTLGAQEFTFPQIDSHTSAQKGAASLIPQLILEQIVSNSTRIPSNKELLNRTLDDLLTKRLALFLQLSAEVKKRDSLVITEPDSKALKKKIAAENEKIAEIQKQIDDNLVEAEKAKTARAKKIAVEENGGAVSEDTPAEDSETDQFSFNKVFGIKGSEDTPVAESIVLYKKDSSQLFTPSKDVLEAGMKSREFEKAVTGEKINGLITGSIVIFGDYASVTAELFVYPGAISLGTITEVGVLSDCSQIAENIAHYLSPKINNGMPIHLYFDVEPKEAVEKARVTIDGLVYDKIPESAVVHAGIHTIEIQSTGWNIQTITWNFKDVPSFLVHAKLTEKTKGTLNISLQKPFLGSFYSNGVYSGEATPGTITSSVSVNGQPVIGQFVTDKHSVKKVRKEVTDDKGNKKYEYEEEEGPLIGSFYYIPEGLAVPDNNLMVKVNPEDNASVIDKRRVWMYRGYSALIVTLPITFFCYGKYDSIYKGYQSNIITDVDSIKKWQVASWGSIGLSCVAGGFFIFELVRYLRAADAVIPTKAKVAKPEIVEKATQESLSLVEENKTDDTSDAAIESTDDATAEKTKSQGTETTTNTSTTTINNSTATGAQ